jgi:hypothetical protein
MLTIGLVVLGKCIHAAVISAPILTPSLKSHWRQFPVRHSRTVSPQPRLTKLDSGIRGFGRFEFWLSTLVAYYAKLRPSAY